MKEKKTINDIGIGWKVIIGIILLIIIYAFCLCAFILVIVGALNINSTTLAILIPAIVAIITYSLNKHYDRNLYNIKYARENKKELYKEYINFIKQQSENDFDLNNLLNYNNKILLIATNEIIIQINSLIIAISYNEKDKINKAIENIIIAIRLDLGYSKISNIDFLKILINNL